MLDVTYGYKVHGRNDRMVEVPRRAVQIASEIALRSDSLVNVFPFRLYFL